MSILFDRLYSLFFPTKSWRSWHSSKPHNSPLCLSSLRRSRDVTTDVYIFNILNSYISFICLVFLSILYICLIHLFIYSSIFIFLLFSAICCPPSAVRIRRPFPPFTDSRHDDWCGGFTKFPRDQEGGIGEWKSNVSFTQWCWHHRNPKLEIWASALLRNVRNIRICMWKIPANTYRFSFCNLR